MRIAFCGHRGTGKTTLADYLVERYGFSKRSLAAPIKQIITECPKDPHDRHVYLWNWAARLFPHNSMTVHAKFVTETARMLSLEKDFGRRAQLLGTDIGRALDDEVWIRYLLRGLPDGDVVVDDVRFENECEVLREYNFILIRLKAPREILSDRLKARGNERRDGNHASERGLDHLPDEYFDGVWDTSEPLAATKARLDELVKQFREEIESVHAL